MKNLDREHWVTISRILRYVKGISYIALCYGGLELVVKGYVDSNFTGDLDKKKVHYKLYVHIYKRSCNLGFNTTNYCAIIYYRSKINENYTSLQRSNMD